MGRLLRSAALVSAVVALSGCWPMPGQGPDRASYNAVEAGLTPATVGELTQAWVSQTFPFAASAPVVSSAGVHVVLGGCGLTTYRLTDGAVLWFSPLSSICAGGLADLVEQFSPPFAVGDRVLWGWLGVLDTPSAEPPQFPQETSNHDVATGDTAPAPTGTIIAGVRGDTVVATSERFTPFQVFPPAVVDWFVNGRINLGSLSDPDDRRTFDTHGGTLPTLGTKAVFHAGPGTLATVPGDAATGQAVRAFSITEPRPGCGPATRLMECPLWATPVDAAATEVVIEPDQTRVYAATSAGTVYALDAATGAVHWTAAVGASVTAPPALAEETLYVPTSDGRLVALGTECGSSTCSPLWETAAGSPLGVQPAVAGGVVYTGADDGSVDAFDAAGCGAATCPALWSAETGTEITGAPAVSNGALYVGTADGRLIAYRRP